jgi:hypothetical protein
MTSVFLRIASIIEFAGQTHVKMSPYKTIKDEVHSSMTLTFTQIQADMRDVAFYFHKKTGLPRLKDSGLADVFLGGRGITVKCACRLRSTNIHTVPVDTLP